MGVSSGRCVQCLQDVGLGVTECPRCGADRTVDVSLGEPVADPKTRFAAARALTALNPQVSFTELQRAMLQPQPLLATGITRALAMQYQAALNPLGIALQIDPRAVAIQMTSAIPSPREKRQVGPLGIIVALIACVGGVLRAVERLNGSDAARSVQSVAHAVGGTAAPGKALDPARAQAVIASTVAIRCSGTLGAGFFVGRNTVLTNDHVLCAEGDTPQIVLQSGRRLLGRVLARDPALDLGVLEVAGADGVPLPLGDAAAMEPGAPVAAVGSPQGLEFSLSQGTVAYVGRERLGVGYLQININVNHGNSGGPVVDGEGRVVGVMSMMVKDANGLGLALPINYALFGERALLPSTGAQPSKSWTALLEHVAAAEHQEVEQARGELHHPGLAAAGRGRDGQLLAFVVQRFPGRPVPVPLSFRVESGGTVGRCGKTTIAPEYWRPMDELEERLPGTQRQWWSWMRKHHLDEGIWAGAAQLRWRDCTPDEGGELVLIDGDEAMNRVPIERLDGPSRAAPAPTTRSAGYVGPVGSAPPMPSASDNAREQLWRGRYRDARGLADSAQVAVEWKRTQLEACRHNGADCRQMEAALQRTLVERDALRGRLQDLDAEATQAGIPAEWRN